MSISSSTKSRATTVQRETQPVTLSERSLVGIAFVRVFVGYLWFQQLFWKLPPDFAGLYKYIVRESHNALIPGYGALLSHTFLAGCASPVSPAGCTLFVPLAAGVWTAELLVAISLMFGLFTRFGAILSCILAAQLYFGLAYADWYWQYGMLILLGLALVAIPAGRRFGIDQWLSPRLRDARDHSRLARIAAWFV
ncbi:MAG TPA: hypothetical protein VGT44_19070 [Ktedonobacteraceae bacterium]|nr:hypothetical protein [Ktedonobacteraceae bacterium]